jgi:hypothetical protein
MPPGASARASPMAVPSGWPAVWLPPRRHAAAVNGLAGSAGFLVSRRPRFGCWRRGRSGVRSGAGLLSSERTSADGCTANSGVGVISGRPGTGPCAPGVSAWPDPSGLPCDPVVGKLSDMHPPFLANYRLLGGELLNNLVSVFAQ